MSLTNQQWISTDAFYGEKWGQLVVQARSSVKGSKTGARRWMTRDEMVKKYGSENIAHELIETKLTDPELRATQIRPHPEVPDREDMRQYLVWDESFETDVEDTVVEQMPIHMALAKRRRTVNSKKQEEMQVLEIWLKMLKYGS
eukprot:Skav208479  [mRNA]  locus=scaffold2430:18497:18928:+ [translate_table: standard]